jgi:hypothetical protein
MINDITACWSKLYGGSGFWEKTLRWEIATAGCRFREIGDAPQKGEPSEASASREARD